VALGVQLDLDTETQSRLGAVATRLDTLSGLSTVQRLGDVHHVSLGIYDGEASEAMLAAIRGFAAATPRLRLPLAAIGVFPGDPGVLYLAPVVTPQFLALHRAFHGAMEGVAPPTRPHYIPDAWVPHVTLALDVAPEALPAAVDIVGETWQPVTARLTALRLIRFFPVETLALHPLGVDADQD
jgi:2'-5' RNA ligase